MSQTRYDEAVRVNGGVVAEVVHPALRLSQRYRPSVLVFRAAVTLVADQHKDAFGNPTPNAEALESCDRIRCQRAVDAQWMHTCRVIRLCGLCPRTSFVSLLLLFTLANSTGPSTTEHSCEVMYLSLLQSHQGEASRLDAAGKTRSPNLPSPKGGSGSGGGSGRRLEAGRLTPPATFSPRSRSLSTLPRLYILCKGGLFGTWKTAFSCGAYQTPAGSLWSLWLHGGVQERLDGADQVLTGLCDPCTTTSSIQITRS